jgi:hypothetical protein
VQHGRAGGRLATQLCLRWRLRLADANSVAQRYSNCDIYCAAHAYRYLYAHAYCYRHAKPESYSELHTGRIPGADR